MSAAQDQQMEWALTVLGPALDQLVILLSAGNKMTQQLRAEVQMSTQLYQEELQSAVRNISTDVGLNITAVSTIVNQQSRQLLIDLLGPISTLSHSFDMTRQLLDSVRVDINNSLAGQQQISLDINNQYTAIDGKLSTALSGNLESMAGLLSAMSQNVISEVRNTSSTQELNSAQTLLRDWMLQNEQHLLTAIHSSTENVSLTQNQQAEQLFAFLQPLFDQMLHNHNDAVRNMTAALDNMVTAGYVNQNLYEQRLVRTLHPISQQLAELVSVDNLTRIVNDLSNIVHADRVTNSDELRSAVHNISGTCTDNSGV